MGGQSTTPKVMAIVAARPPGSLITREYLAERAGLTGEQVAAVLYRAAKRPDPIVEVVERGHVWRVVRTDSEPEVRPDPGTFTGRILDRTGPVLVIRGEDGYLYLLKRIGLAED